MELVLRWGFNLKYGLKMDLISGSSDRVCWLNMSTLIGVIHDDDGDDEVANNILYLLELCYLQKLIYKWSLYFILHLFLSASSHI